MEAKKYKELRNKDNLVRDIKLFDLTGDLIALADVYIDIQKIFKAEEFPIIRYINSKRIKNVKKKQITKQNRQKNRKTRK